MKKLLLMALFLVCANITRADDAQILVITGKVGNHTRVAAGVKQYVFALNDLLKLPQVSITTTTHWTAKTVFRGPLISDVLAKAGISDTATEVLVNTLDDYPVKIPVADFKKWHVILAVEADGKRLTINNKGPLWVMYPMDDHPAELKNNLTTSRLAWAVNGFVVR
ncbi:molybdopterin-dependent oxidoreductase [Andreprevotia chitinilytica]|uniref:molybdopterin-dependent oxidoreductase n=1 Tax=Andreprevotia chitinilytica TaxID=396808 RepID=UPI00054FB0EB|nr:molybdopterin-dependent oxidoreductase [Andreprevotia chitinilytica]